MSREKKRLCCPHCGSVLQAFALPGGTGWEGTHQWACFNDECSYYRDGWDWIWQQYGVKASYRYRIVDPESGRASPIAVWSRDALRDLIVEEN